MSRLHFFVSFVKEIRQKVLNARLPRSRSQIHDRFIHLLRIPCLVVTIQRLAANHKHLILL